MYVEAWAYVGGHEFQHRRLRVRVKHRAGRHVRANGETFLLGRLISPLTRVEASVKASFRRRTQKKNDHALIFTLLPPPRKIIPLRLHASPQKEYYPIFTLVPKIKHKPKRESR